MKMMLATGFIVGDEGLTSAALNVKDVVAQYYLCFVIPTQGGPGTPYSGCAWDSEKDFMSAPTKVLTIRSHVLWVYHKHGQELI